MIAVSAQPRLILLYIWRRDRRRLFRVAEELLETMFFTEDGRQVFLDLILGKTWKIVLGDINKLYDHILFIPKVFLKEVVRAWDAYTL